MFSERAGDKIDLTLIDKNDSFFFGYSKLDVMFGCKTSDAVRIPYRGILKPDMPDVVAATNMTYDGWIPVNPDDLSTEYEGVYAIGDVADVGTPKAGMFAEGDARTAAENIIANLLGTEEPVIYRGVGTCYVEFGKNMVGRVDVEFMEGPATGKYYQASAELAAEKEDFGASRRARWFGL